MRYCNVRDSEKKMKVAAEAGKFIPALDGATVILFLSPSLYKGWRIWNVNFLAYACIRKRILTTGWTQKRFNTFLSRERRNFFSVSFLPLSLALTQPQDFLIAVSRPIWTLSSFSLSFILSSKQQLLVSWFSYTRTTTENLCSLTCTDQPSTSAKWKFSFTPARTDMP